MSNTAPRSTIRRSAITGSLALALVASIFGPASAAAQQETLLQGVVSDESTGQLIASATVTLPGIGSETRTNAYGVFEFSGVPTGKVSVRVQAPGYPAVVEEIEITPGAVVIMQVRVPNVYAMLGLLVETRAPDRYGQDEAKTAADLLSRQVPGLSRNSSEVGRSYGPVRLRGVQSINASSEPVLFLDGVRVGGEAMDILTKIPASEVRDIRVLRGPTAAFIYGAANGAILVVTQSGSRR